MARRRGSWRPPVKRPSAASHALEAARSAVRLSCAGLARALQLHPRTVCRWELGLSRPPERQWSRILAFYASRAPNVAQTLAAAVGRPLPAPAAPRAIERDVAIRVVASAADALDVAPRRVLEVLRAAAQAASDAGLGLELVVRAAAAETASSAPSDGSERTIRL